MKAIIVIPIYREEPNNDEICSLKQVFNVLSAHNFILAMLLKGGFVLLGIFVGIIVVCVRTANKFVTPANTLLQFGCCSFLLMMTMESYSMMFVFYYLFLNYFSVNLYLEDGEQVS